MNSHAPFLTFTGAAGDETAQYYVCCEQSVLLESKTVKDAIVDMMATYFVFDIADPKGHQCCIPVPTLRLVSNLNKLS